jgi:predicted SnoaL-like aldol condensation-catalyzing enzyme
MTNDSIQSRKQASTDFLQLIVSGHIDEAFEKHADPNGKHHNTFNSSGFPALRKAMIENENQFSNKQFKIKNVLGDNDLVAVHSHLAMNPGESGMIVVHLFRFRGDKIIEFWDCGQPIPADSPNSDGAF